MIKNKVEYHGDIALIHVNRNGFSNIVIVDAEDMEKINKLGDNHLNIDSGGYVQYRDRKGGHTFTIQVHRYIANALEFETVGFKNGNRLDLRKKNLYCRTDYTKRLYFYIWNEI